jgi:hypothetical protein
VAGAGAVERVSGATALLIAILALVAAVRWTAAHPQPLWWDEANYYNQVIGDRTAFIRGGLPGVARSLLFADAARPPAYRMGVLPLLVEPPPLDLLRRVALVMTIVAMALLAWAARAVATRSSALLAASFTLAMPAVLTAGAWFGTEYPLFLSVALLLASLLRGLRFGLTVAVALGLLAKTTFVVIAAPAILVALLLARDWRARRDLLVPSAIGALAASGWWFWNAGPALRFGQLGRTFERASLGDVYSLATALQKVRIVLEEGLGYGVAVALLVLLVATLAMRRQASERWPPEQRRALLIAVAATVPLLLLLAFSPVFVARHFAPALLPVTVLVALLLDRLPASARVAAAALALAQVAGLAAAPERFLPLIEQTDWSRLRAAVPGRTPHIAYLGNWGSLSPPEIRYGWTRSGDEATVTWLWRFEWRTIDWRRVEAEAVASDAVLVVPPGTPGRDNQYNAELVRRLEASGTFEPPVPFTIGTRAPIALLLYRRMRQSTSALWLRSRECRQAGVPVLHWLSLELVEDRHSCLSALATTNPQRETS